MVRAVIKHPLVNPPRPATATAQVPDLEAIRRWPPTLFPEPGGTPIPLADPQADRDAEADARATQASDGGAPAPARRRPGLEALQQARQVGPR